MVLITSCNMYHPKEMIKIGDEMISKDKLKVDTLIKISNRIALNYCTVSLGTYGTNEIYQYIDSIHEVDNGSVFKISDKDEQSIRRFNPRKDIEDIIAVKDLYIALVFQKERDYNHKYGKIIYCFDENKFKKCFPNYHYYYGNQVNNIIDSSKWVYFYDKNWGISTSSVFLHIDSTECKKILSGEK